MPNGSQLRDQITRMNGENEMANSNYAARLNLGSSEVVQWEHVCLLNLGTLSGRDYSLSYPERGAIA